MCTISLSPPLGSSGNDLRILFKKRKMKLKIIHLFKMKQEIYFQPNNGCFSAAKSVLQFGTYLACYRFAWVALLAERAERVFLLALLFWLGLQSFSPTSRPHHTLECYNFETLVVVLNNGTCLIPLIESPLRLAQSISHDGVACQIHSFVCTESKRRNSNSLVKMLLTGFFTNEAQKYLKIQENQANSLNPCERTSVHSE